MFEGTCLESVVCMMYLKLASDLPLTKSSPLIPAIERSSDRAV